ncbi:PREDICTED: uncharacterized protein LOC103338092 [Prunus mume]|uniref:Uncharacterized protein LOC103338092 n=1 Tax=Prunus mume TaxID=102107 RepID=A0ABM0PH10_PRUMU|nr:PREDICTED: uncharacterized protein LOC103338092 [Prunus mume]
MKIQKGKERPTMKTHQVEEERESVTKLQKQFMILQQDWDSYKQSNPRAKRRHSTNSSSFTMVKNLDQLLDTSPRHLMSSLQHGLSPSQGEWPVRTNDLVEEIRRERRAAIESGKLKGRRLFEAEECETEMGFGGTEGIWCGGNGLAQEREVRSVSFDDSDADDDYGSGKSKEIAVCFQGCYKTSSSSSSSLSDEDVEREVEIEARMKLVSVEEKRVDNKYEGGNGRRCTAVIMPWLAIALLVSAIFFIRGFAGYPKVDEVVLVPT